MTDEELLRLHVRAKRLAEGLGPLLQDVNLVQLCMCVCVYMSRNEVCTCYYIP